jgi:4-amino-4-deoxy-L-arabinose transferase-like glycosyltransferase
VKLPSHTRLLGLAGRTGEDLNPASTQPDASSTHDARSSGNRPPERGHRSRTGKRPVPPLRTIAVCLVVAFGLFLRLWILGRNPVTADQAVVGLMAREILRGHLFTFYWGQSYGGGEPYVVAALFAVVGQSRLALGLSPLLLDAIAALLVWRIGRRLFDSRVGVLAALLFWIWPEVYLYLSTVEYGFRYLTLVCGLGVLLFALRVTQQRAPRLGDWAALGLFLGVGWWCSPEIVYYAVPSLGLLAYCAVRGRLRLRPAALALLLATTILGALPWLVANVGSGYPSLQTGTIPPTTWFERARVFVEYVVPMVLGLRLRGTGAWLLGAPAGIALCGLLVASILAWLVVLCVQRRAPVLVAFLVLFPFAYVYSSYSWYWADGRYGVYLAPVLALFVASALSTLARRRQLAHAAPALGLVAALALTGVAAARLAPYVPLSASGTSRAQWTTWRFDPDLWARPLVAALERQRTTDVYANYWVANVLTFDARGRIVAVDPANDRYPPYLAAIERSRVPAWVFVRPSSLPALDAVAGPHDWTLGGAWTAQNFETYLTSRNYTFRVAYVGWFAIVLPSRPVAPSVVLRALKRS